MFFACGFSFGAGALYVLVDDADHSEGVKKVNANEEIVLEFQLCGLEDDDNIVGLDLFVAYDSAVLKYNVTSERVITDAERWEIAFTDSGSELHGLINTVDSYSGVGEDGILRFTLAFTGISDGSRRAAGEIFVRGIAVDEDLNEIRLDDSNIFVTVVNNEFLVRTVIIASSIIAVIAAVAVVAAIAVKKRG